MSYWQPDILGEGYEQRVLPLGVDPDGEGEIAATLVRRAGASDARRALIFVHGFSDYFFQAELADFFADRGYAFYALDLRKCGRSRRPGQTAHYVSDLALYDDELGQALAIVREETGGGPVVVAGHSTGGLVLPLWLNRLERAGGTRHAGIEGLILDSPWFDLQGKPAMRSYFTQALRVLARVVPKKVISMPPTDSYGTSLHSSAHGEWDFDTMWKPLTGFPVTFGWLNAVRRGHARLHKGIEVGVPALVLHSDKSWFSRAWSEEVDVADNVLDVKQIADWSSSLGREVRDVTIADGRHDLFLSQELPRKATYAAIDEWLQEFVTV